MSAPAIATASPPETVTRVTLSDALAFGPGIWEDIQAQAESRSPFMSWEWHRAWADADPEATAEIGRASCRERV